MSPGQRLPAYAQLIVVAAPDVRELLDGPLVVIGRIMPASNHTFLTRLGETAVQCVYKPTSGERPLWDFTDGTLAAREYAAWVVSEHLGWDIVPPTVLRDGPAGPGMVQLWMESEEGTASDRTRWTSYRRGRCRPASCTSSTRAGRMTNR